MLGNELSDILIERRRAIEVAAIDPHVKSLILEQFDKLTDELKKGNERNEKMVTALWGMIYGGLNAVTTSAATLASIDKLKRLIDK